ncbi:hypothetical protein CJU89_1530 [Yarrowia sp. B02]|nr:hypothetical protein CJU89_1530 [Yarrowia sp. B02]
MAVRKTPLFATICVLFAAAYAIWTISHSVYQQIIIGTVDSSVVFEHRIHTYVVDERGDCETPKWVGGSGTLVTAADCAKEGWTVEKTPGELLAVAYDLCARGHKMNCLVVSNTQAASHRSLSKLVRLSLAKYANEDVVWHCGPGCSVVPAQFAWCVAYKQFGPSFVPDDFSEDTAKCRLLQHEDLSLLHSLPPTPMLMRRRKRLVVLALLVILTTLIYAHSAISADPLATQHFSDTFDTFIITKECRRSFDYITSIVPPGTVLTDDHEKCMENEADDWDYQTHQSSGTNEWGYTEKYKRALELCAESDKSKCLILEDDIVFINSRRTIFARIKLHTMFGGPRTAWDCSKVGLGWIKTGQTGNKSICRIIDKRSAPCLASEMLRYALPADVALKLAQIACKVNQHRFLLTQHTGFKSYLGEQREQNPLWVSPPPKTAAK